MAMEMWSNLGTLTATIFFVATMARNYLPRELYEYFREPLRRLARYLSPYIILVIEENEGIKINDLYESVQIYLRTLSSSAAARLKLSKPQKATAFTFTMDKGQQIMDEFQGFKAWWTLRSRECKPPLFSRYNTSDEKRHFELKFHKKDKARVFETYLPHVIAEAKILVLKNRQRKIYTNKRGKSHS
ncbi:hypothetical protein SUGI_0688070 [Cryptomeria japonica]|uniref:AAA-ATPase ASD, mitochondrial-like n=1 Tax=Cryptomeria japonica TaxID=3369 RepID=UPI002414797E|nr:AAA-ATPase ASD, mitochondrial-like [Cryptomeria japonica]GLJ34242.1 hypothetical protein SUGI_0688070 [Cryptomeria japonica]